jgi:enoyl-CoA hydratase
MPNIADLNSRRGWAHYQDFAVVLHRVFRRFEESAKSTIEAVNGWARGGGAEFLLTTNIRLMADDAKLGLPEIKLGVFPGGGSSPRLMRQIPLCQAKMLMFTGDFISAGEAAQRRLVNRAVGRADLMNVSMALAQRIADKSPWALRMHQSSMLHGADMPLSASLAHEMATISLILESDDAHQGCSAFLEKRQPRFLGS